MTASRDAAAALADTYGHMARAVARLDDMAFYGPTRCTGMAVGDLLVHLRLDAERALVAFATPHPGPADRDFASYWSDFHPVVTPKGAEGDDDAGPGDQAFAKVRYVRAVATAYERPSVGLVTHFADVTAAAARAATATVDGFITTQGHVLSVPDFVATLVVEACVHALDLAPAVVVQPPPAALGIVTSTLDALADADVCRSTGWDRVGYVLKGTGRVPLTKTDRSSLGDLAARFPLFG